MPCSLPVLHSPHFKKSFIVKTDASEHGIGAVLSRQETDRGHPVSYFSCKFSLAIVWVMQTLLVYLYGQNFTIQTDHRLLQWLDQIKNNNRQLTHWSLLLQSYKLRIWMLTCCLVYLETLRTKQKFCLWIKRGIWDDIFKWQTDILLIFLLN